MIFELVALADRTMVPIVDPIAIEIRLANLGPVLAGVRASIRILIEALAPGVFKRRIAALIPRRIQAAQSAVDRVAKLMDADAFVVISIQRQAQQVLLTKTRRLASRAANALV